MRRQYADTSSITNTTLFSALQRQQGRVMLCLCMQCVATAIGYSWLQQAQQELGMWSRTLLCLQLAAPGCSKRLCGLKHRTKHVTTSMWCNATHLRSSSSMSLRKPRFSSYVAVFENVHLKQLPDGSPRYSHVSRKVKDTWRNRMTGCHDSLTGTISAKSRSCTACGSCMSSDHAHYRTCSPI